MLIESKLGAGTEGLTRVNCSQDPTEEQPLQKRPCQLTKPVGSVGCRFLGGDLRPQPSSSVPAGAQRSEKSGKKSATGNAKDDKNIQKHRKTLNKQIGILPNYPN